MKNNKYLIPLISSVVFLSSCTSGVNHEINQVNKNSLDFKNKVSQNQGDNIDKTGYISTIAGNGYRKKFEAFNEIYYIGTGLGDNGKATDYSLTTPFGIHYDEQNNLYICELIARKVKKVDTNGIITNLAGPGDGTKIEGYPANQTLIESVTSITTDKNGNIYIMQFPFNVIIKIDAKTNLVSNFAGGANFPQLFDTPAKETLIERSYYMHYKKDEDAIYLSETNNQIITKIINVSDPDPKAHIIKHIAGTGYGTNSALNSFSPQGTVGEDGIKATDSNINYPVQICFDEKNNIYFADAFNHKIRRIDAVTGIISTFVGDGFARYTGDNIPATSASLSYPFGLAYDGKGNLYISDSGNNRIRKIYDINNPDPSKHIITTIAGDGYSYIKGRGVGGTGRYTGDDKPAIESSLNYPSYIIFDKDGNLVFSDTGNNRIRKVII